MLWQPERQYGIWSLYREVQAGIRVNRLHINRVNVREQFESYIAPYDLSDPKIRLKAEHTYRVAELCARIAASLSVPAEDEDLAWLLGMLHDIGRFEQVRRYGTFVDA